MRRVITTTFKTITVDKEELVIKYVNNVPKRAFKAEIFNNGLKRPNGKGNRTGEMILRDRTGYRFKLNGLLYFLDSANTWRCYCGN